MNKLLVCQHVPHEILGTLNPHLKGAGFRIRYMNFGRNPQGEPKLDGYQGLVLLGGPMSANDTEHYRHLDTEVRLVEEALKRDIPVLGICLGAQIIARTLGAKVTVNKEKEIGWYDVEMSPEGRKDPLFSHCRASEKIFQWHGDRFEIPDGAVHLASSRGCDNQAFRYRDNVYGFQFHMEVDEPLIERWLSVPLHQRELEGIADKTGPEKIRRDTRENITRLQQIAVGTFNGFMGLFGKRKRLVSLPSR